MTFRHCTGWWEQAGFGRQLMHPLQISFHNSRLTGHGQDAIASFTLQGNLRSDGAIEIVKQYTNLHSVLYVGKYDGEGMLYGDWDIDGYRGKWAIKIVGNGQQEMTEIEEFVPSEQEHLAKA